MGRWSGGWGGRSSTAVALLRVGGGGGGGGRSKAVVLVLQLVWLNEFNAELSLKRYWQGPRSQEVGEEGGCTKLTLSPPE